MNNTALFLGSGFSKVSGLPTTKELEKGFLSISETKASPSAVQDLITKHIESFWKDVFGWRPSRPNPSLEEPFYSFRSCCKYWA